MTYLDTHVALWLCQHEHDRLSLRALHQIERGGLLVSPMVLLELELLREIGRLTAGGAEIVARLSRETGLKVCDLPFPTVVECAMTEGWIRDPFDRLIVAQARANRAPLITKDRAIRQHYVRAVW